MESRQVVDIIPAQLLNSTTAPQLHDELLAVSPDVDIRLDLSGVRFFGVDGVAAIMAGLRSRADGPGQVELFDPSPPALRCIAEFGFSDFATVTVPVSCER